MAEHGYDAATVAPLVDEAGVPASSIYHYFGSKEGVLLAVMERGADRFFEALPIPERRIGSQVEHLRALVAAVASTLEHHPDFLRILVVMAAQPVNAEEGEVHSVVNRVRELALVRLVSRCASSSASIRMGRRLIISHGSRLQQSTAPSSPTRPIRGSTSVACSSPCRPP